MSGGRHVVVVGGGISGLAAAWYLRQGGQVRVTVVEASPRIGGKLQVSEVAGVSVDAGAEALLTRRPEGLDLVAAVGAGDQLIYPGTTRAALFTRGVLRPMPTAQVMGVPYNLTELAATGILSEAGLQRAALDEVLPATPVYGDISVALYIRARLGGEVLQRLVEPLLGGVYAGSSDALSLEATMPALARAARTEPSVLAAAARIAEQADQAAPSSGPRPPVFATLRSGLGSLPATIAAAGGAEVRTGVRACQLHRTAAGWRLVTTATQATQANATWGGLAAERVIDADAVIIAAPAAAAAQLLHRHDPAAAADLAQILYAPAAIVTLAYPRAAFPAPPTGSGYLVPPADARPVKAVTFSSIKWPHLQQNGGELLVVRCSIGGAGHSYSERYLGQCEDAELVGLAMAEMREVLGVCALPVDSRVSRWEQGMPQYHVGHLQRVARLRASLARHPGLAVCGAAYDGPGIPACIATARTAADQVLTHLAHLDQVDPVDPVDPRESARRSAALVPVQE